MIKPDRPVDITNEWDRIEDGSPQDNEEVLVWLQAYDVRLDRVSEHMLIARFDAAENRYCHGWDGEVVFWRPLPEPPVEAQE